MKWLEELRRQWFVPSENSRAVECGMVKTALGVGKFEFETVGIFCPECGISKYDERNLFDILAALEERSAVASEGELQTAKRRVALLKEDVERKQQELEIAEQRLRELEAKPRLNEAESFRQLPAHTPPTTSE